MSARAVTWFRVIAFAEAVSWAGLLVGMYFKWVQQSTELGVKVFGPIHGAIFVAYLLAVVAVRRQLRWTLGTTVLALAAGVPPFATAVFEEWAHRTGRLSAPDAVREAERDIATSGARR